MNNDYKSPRVTSGFPECPLPVVFDAYKFCSFNCIFCLSNYNKCSNPNSKEIFDNGIVKSVKVDRIIKLFNGEKPNDPLYKNYIKHKKVIQWGTLGDPFCNFERQRGVGYKLLKYFAEIEYPIRFNTKGVLPLEGKYKQLLEDNAEKLKDKWAFLYSIITTDEQIAKKIELGVPSPNKRYEALAFLSNLGYFTGHRLRPFILGVSDKTLDDMLKRDLEIGVDSLSSEIYCVDLRATGLSKKMFKVMSNIVGYNVQKFYAKCSPSNAGLLRLTSKIKEPHFLKMYEWCKKHNKIFASNDPHFKHLNTTYNCCGLPEGTCPLGNYSKFTTTSVVRYLHNNYLNGGKITITWTEFVKLFGNNNTEFLKSIMVSDPMFISGYIEKHKTGELNLFDYMHNLWNSPHRKARGTLYYYYDGKLKPVGTDKNKDVIYQYVPSGYENNNYVK